MHACNSQIKGFASGTLNRLFAIISFRLLSSLPVLSPPPQAGLFVVMQHAIAPDGQFSFNLGADVGEVETLQKGKRL